MGMDKCPHCGADIDAAAILGARKSKAKAASSRRNGKLGGRPRKKPASPVRHEDANQTAYRVVREAEKLTQQVAPPQRPAS